MISKRFKILILMVITSFLIFIMFGDGLLGYLRGSEPVFKTKIRAKGLSTSMRATVVGLLRDRVIMKNCASLHQEICLVHRKLLKLLKDYEDEVLITDGWGNQFRYDFYIDEKGIVQTVIISNGENEIFEAGNGDDLVFINGVRSN